MTEVSIKEIPVQILTMPAGATLILRLPGDELDPELANYWETLMYQVLNRSDIGIVALPSNVDLAVVQK